MIALRILTGVSLIALTLGPACSEEPTKDKPAGRIVLVIGEEEYHTWDTLPAFARQELEPRGLECIFVHADPGDPNRFSGLEALNRADLLVLSVRRRTPPAEQLERIRKYLDAGKPLAGIRTASHAFDNKPPQGHAAWASFDVDVLGADYQGHYGLDPPTSLVQMLKDRKDHPVLAGIQAEPVQVRYSLYKNRDPAKSVTTLITGHQEGNTMQEPVAWTNTYHGGRVFYTSLGGVDDFQHPFFRRLLLNGIYWSLSKPAPDKLLSADPPEPELTKLKGK